MTNSRKQVALVKKQEALALLGSRSDGTFGDPKINQTTNKPWSAATIAGKYEVSKAAVVSWKKRPKEIMSVSTDTRAAKKLKRIKQGHFTELESALSIYMRSRMAYMNGSSLFRADVVGSMAKKVVLELQERWTQQLAALSLAQNVDDYEELHDKQQLYISFKCSPAWIQNFMRRNGFHSVKGGGDEGFVVKNTLFTERLTLQRALCKFHISCISNTDEVALLYRALPRRSIRDCYNHSSYHLIKDRLTAVLTVYADGRKAPLTVIGKSARPCSFPRHFDAARDMGIFYNSQQNAWNTQHIWAQIFRGLNKRSLLQNRAGVNVIDNCSAHTISYEEFEALSAIFLPPNMTSVLQPVDASIGRSFKCAFRRLLVEHILAYVEKKMALPLVERKPFKMNEAVSTYDAVRLMKEAWDLVPVSVVLNGWLKTGILAPFQNEMIRQRKEDVGAQVCSAEKAFESSCFKSERKTRDALSKLAAEQGNDWLANLANERIDGEDESVDVPTFDMENVRESCRDIQELASLDLGEGGDTFEQISEEDLDFFTEQENEVPVCRPVDEECAVEGAVTEALQTIEETQRCDSPQACDQDEQQLGNSEHNEASVSVENVPSLPQFDVSLQSLQDEVKLLKKHGHPFADKLQNLEVVLAQTARELMRYRKQTRRQSRIDSFFKK